MDFLETLYPQKKLGLLLKTMDEQTVNVYPWINEELLITDELGNTLGFISETSNDYTLYNEHMNMIAATNEVQDFSILHDFSGNTISYVHDMPNGFTELAFTGEQIDAFSNVFGGYDFISSGEVIGQSKLASDHFTFTYNPIETHFSSFDFAGFNTILFDAFDYYEAQALFDFL
ncbi:hypothetical protein RRV45_03305 [Bacillus sp. DTU_2020_1000418_1_SI_GHA_SEK_038]|uniref:hypothetical protein n=1 Tax=Bacillus sp. DTU_2020_1000418_1_SI_GHA_SEK_038 TaxID=3077585 RepID=UPI0028E9091F|nr:hypothetical protein [Bacillus sp. DTU_2020_1000418_1_SI_GHA_SEK_038]WNS76053.1 hypothetical protein RRV45_03305 [Bacillus sp. DTU_2020_1000418_1_SI_GHA_SEK_038]